MGNWLNSDGLYLQFGPEKAVPNIAGEYRTAGSLREIEATVTLTGVGTNPTILSDNTFFPKNFRIEEVEVFVQTAATGATAVLNLGLIATDRTTEIDFNGLLAALPLASIDTAGEKTVVRVGSTGAGAMIGTTNTTVGYICADWDTAAFTAGVLKIRIRGYGV